MLCPQCGKECQEGYNFCLSCGCKLSVGENNRIVDNNPYRQNYQNFESFTNNAPQAAMTYDSAGVMQSKKSSAAKRGIIIAVVALLVALLGVTAFLFIKNKAERDFLVNNPTKYVYSSYQTYFDNSNSDENDILAVLKNCKEQGSVKFSAEQANRGSNGEKISSDVKLSYNIPDNKYYFMMSGSNVPVQYSDSSKNALFELYTDVNRIDFNFDMNGKQGKYYIDSGKIREQAGNSIFSPDKDNVLNINEEQFNQFIDQFENIYRGLADKDASNEELKKLCDSFLKKLEQDCKVTVEEGSATVNGNNVSSDIVTYTMDYDAILAILNDVKEELVDYTKNNRDKLANYDDSAEEIEESIDKLISDLTEKSELKDIMIVLKNYIRKDNKEIAKLELSFKASDSTSAGMNITLEFSREPYMNIKFTVSSGMLSVGASLYKEVNGDVVSYILSASSVTQSATESQEIARLDYDNANNKLTLTAGGKSYTCDAKVEDNKVTLSFDVPTVSSYASSDAQTMTVKIEISSETEMNTINAEKNLFDITKEEFENMTVSTYDPYAYGDFDDYYDNYDDYNDYNDYSYYDDNGSDYNYATGSEVVFAG